MSAVEVYSVQYASAGMGALCILVSHPAQLQMAVLV